MSLTANKLESHNVRRGSRSSQDSAMQSPSNNSFGRESSHQSQAAQSDNASAQFSASSFRPPASPRAKSLASESTSGGDAVKVICRVRPFAKRELEIQDELNSKFANDWEKLPLRSVVEMVDGKTTNFLDHDKNYSLRQSFAFDHSLWSVEKHQQDSHNETATQEDVYRIVGLPAVANVWAGYNTCVFAYGQTGSGKTYSMMGTDEQPGLIPRICHALFDELQRRKSEEEGTEPGVTRDYKLEGRFLEIYNEKVKDLLWELRDPEACESTTVGDRENLKIRLVPGQGPQVVGLTNVQVRSSDDCIALIEEGTRNRSVAATKMNEQSSRSHSIFRLTLTQTTTVLPQKQFEKPKHYHRTSTVSLVDLAGSERNKKTGAEGERLKEAVAINKSLTTLKNVIDALVEQRAVVPYRDSTLTWLLSDNLGGNSKTFMIACVSPHLDNAEESLNTLRYAIRTQAVVTHAHVNESNELRRMARMKSDMERMKAQLLDTGEDALRSRADELTENLRSKQEENSRQLQLVDVLNDALARTKELQLAAAFANRFHLTINHKNENALRSASDRLKQDIELLAYDIQRLEKDLQQAKDARKAAASEEKSVRNRKIDLERELYQCEAKAELLDARKSSLLAEDQDNTDSLDRKAPLAKSARFVAHLLVALEMHQCTQALDRLALEQNQAVEDEKAEQAVNLVATQNEGEARVAAAQRQQDALREQIKQAKAEQQRATAELADRARRLHSRCIFFDNENKRCVQHADADVQAASKKELSKLQTEEEEWRRKVAEVNVAGRSKFDKDREQSKTTVNMHQGEHDANVDRLKELAEKAIARDREAADESVSGIETDYAHRLRLLVALNDDSRSFALQAAVAEPRYLPLFQTLSAMIARRDAPSNRLPQDYEDAIASMKAIVVEKRRTAVPLAYRSEGGDGESTFGALTPRSRSEAAPSEAPTTPRRMHNSPSLSSRSTSRVAQPTNGHRHQPDRFSGMHSPASTTLGSTIEFLHAGQRPPVPNIPEIKSLRQPAKTIAQPTRTSLLRCGVINYKRPASNQSLGMSTPARTPARVVSDSPARWGTSTSPGPTIALTPRSTTGGGDGDGVLRSVTPTRLASRSPARVIGGGAPQNMVLRSEARTQRIDPGASPLEPLGPTGEHAPADRAYAPVDEDGQRRKIIYGANGFAVLSRSKSPARVGLGMSATASSSADMPATATNRSTSPSATTRRTAWR
jgi:hypothetical protein